MSIKRTVTVEIHCDHSNCPVAFALADSRMAIYKIRDEAIRRGWHATSSTTMRNGRDLCPEHISRLTSRRRVPPTRESV